MNQYEIFALCHFLSFIPEDTNDFHTIVERVHDLDQRTDLDVDDESVPVIWEPFSHMLSEDVAILISDMADELRHVFVAKYPKRNAHVRTH